MKKNLTKIIFLILALALAIVPVLAISSFAEGETVTLDVPLGVNTPSMNADGTLPVAEAPEGYTFVGWTESVQNGENITSAPEYFVAGTVYDGEATVLHALYSKTVAGGSGSKTYELFSGNLEEGNYVIVYGTYAMKATVSSNRLGYEAVTKNGKQVVDPGDTIIWTIAKSGDCWTIYNKSVGKYAASNGTKNQAQLLASGTDDKSLWTASGTSTYEFVNKNNAAKKVNANLRNNGTYGFACYSTSTGGSLSLYKETVTGGGESVTYYSTMTSYTASFVGPDGAVNALRAADNKITVPGAPTYEGVFDAQAYEFAGWSATELANDDTVKPTMLTATSLELTEDVTYYAVYSYVKKEGDGPVVESGWQLVTNATTLAVNDRIIIASADSSYAIGAISTTSTKYGIREALTKSGTTITPSSAVSILTLVKGSADGSFALKFNDTSTYLYWNSGNSLATNATISDNTSWTISFTDTKGTAKITNVKDKSRELQYNSSSPRFACYTGTQNNPIIYKFVEGNSTTFYATKLTSKATDVTKFDSASVTIGSDLAMNYYITLKSGESIGDYSMKFTFGGEETVVETATLVGDKYMFTFSGITPEKMGDNIKAELLKDGELVCDYDNYSVKENLETVRDTVAETTEEQKALINATLVYGAAAQQYRKYNTDNLVAEIPDNLTGPDKKNVREKTDSTVSGLEFTAAGVNFDYCNRVYIKYENTTGTDAEVKVFIGNKQCATKVVENNGVITVYSDALKATELGTTVRFEIWQNGAEVQELKYSVNDYVFGMKNTDDVALKNLIFALYQYGVAAKACN